MSRQLSSILKISVAGFVLISVGACKPADKGQGALASQGVEALNLSRADTSVFGKYFATNACDTEEMEALGALAGLGLGEDGANGLSFKSRNFDAGRVTYTNLRMTETTPDADGETQTHDVSAEKVVFHCPKMSEGGPIFDRLDVKEASFEEDGTIFTFDTLSAADPTAAAAKSLLKGSFEDKSHTSGTVGFGAISMTGVKATGKEINGTLSALAWGENRTDATDGTADLMVDDLDITIVGENGAQDMTLDFSGMSVRNLRMGKQLDQSSGLSPNDAVAEMVKNMNIFEKPYDELVIGTLDLDSEGFTVDFDGIEGKTVKKGGVITTRQTLNPTKITLKPALGENREFKQAYEMLKSLNFETLEMSGSSVTTLNKDDDTVSVSDGLFIIKDAMRLNFEYEAEGIDEMIKTLEAASGDTDQDKAASLYDPLKLRSMRLTLEDQSIVERGLKLASQMTGQSEKNLKRSLGMLSFGAAMAAQNDVQAEVYSETAEAFADFVKDGGTLTIEVNPPAPVSLAPLMTGKGENIDPATLGFSASQASDAP